MAIHISARVAWHDNGWNGCICRNPACNTHCQGAHSYPGDKIAKGKNSSWEASVAGQRIALLTQDVTCGFSAHAFDPEPATMFDDPPDFFTGGERVLWDVPPYTVCTWPYEAMYDEAVKTDGNYDAKKRLEAVKAHFDAVEIGKSLLFLYANYSNPFSSEDSKHYILIGVSRISVVGELYHYPNLPQSDIDKYGGFVWERPVTMDYANQGFRIPYHLYNDRPDVLERLAVFPDNERNFKYASRQLSDDDALSIIERFIEVATYLRDELHDSSENWTHRLEWLNGLLAELWSSRGLYPGFGRILDMLGLGEGIVRFKEATAQGHEVEFKNAVVEWLNENPGAQTPWSISEKDASKVQRTWKLKDDDERRLLSGIFPRFDLLKEQFETILSKERSDWSVEASLQEIEGNPFILAEQYEGSGPDDRISYSKVEHGLYPSPSIGRVDDWELDDWRRLRALLVEALKRETKHSFRPSGVVLQEVNRRLSLQPEWKKTMFSERYLSVDKKSLEQALVFTRYNDRDYLYLREVFEDERDVERQLKALAGLPDITFKSPLRPIDWIAYLTKQDCSLARNAAADYAKAIEAQASICDQVFRKPVAVICGGAGTGKTTVVESIIKAIEKAHGQGTSFCLLAPTGKAADRMRDKTGKEALTIHSFLAKRGWLRENMTYRRNGGKKEEGISTFIIDESSMLDLSLFACLVRAINWNAVQRLILVGDPNQLPPIGRGRIFADLIAWLKRDLVENVGELSINLRQLENRVNDCGTGILDLAELFKRKSNQNDKSEDDCLAAELFFQRLQDLPPDGVVDKDLRVIYWKNGQDLQEKLLAQIVADMQEETGKEFDSDKPWELWKAAWSQGRETPDPLYQQVLSPYRNEDYGTNPLNLALQSAAQSRNIKRLGTIGGITIFDKVIQIRNRGKSEPIMAFNWRTRNQEKVNVFNGELGMVEPVGYEASKWLWPRFKFERFAVKFSRKEHLAVNYDKKSEKPEDNLELAYAISVHKAQGSEFCQVYFVIPKKPALLSPELLYTGLTRATRHSTVLIEGDIGPLLKMYRPESSHLESINSSLFGVHIVPNELAALRVEGFLEKYRIHRSLANVMVRSKSEVIIANMLFDREIPFWYEKPLYARDGSFYLPDFTILWHGQEYYWEHLGLLEQDKYRAHWEEKQRWYEKNFPSRLITTEESGELSIHAQELVQQYFTKQKE